MDRVKPKKRSKNLELLIFSKSKNKTLHIHTCNLKDQQREMCILHETNVFDIYKLKETMHFIKKVSFQKKSKMNSQSKSKFSHDNVECLQRRTISNLLRKQYGMQVN